MITYKPLRITLAEKDMVLRDLQVNDGGVLNKRTVSKLRHDMPMNLESIRKICLFIDVPIEKVVEIIRS